MYHQYEYGVERGLYRVYTSGFVPPVWTTRYVSLDLTQPVLWDITDGPTDPACPLQRKLVMDAVAKFCVSRTALRLGSASSPDQIMHHGEGDKVSADSSSRGGGIQTVTSMRFIPLASNLMEPSGPQGMASLGGFALISELSLLTH